MKLKLLPSSQDFGLGFDERVGEKKSTAFFLNCVVATQLGTAVSPVGRKALGDRMVHPYQS